MMKKNLTNLLLLVLAAVLFTAGTRQTTIFIIGDSTAANKSKPETNPERGWGMAFQGFFGPKVRVDNHAVNGRSSKSFIDEGRWDKVLSRIKPGDYVLIQFGHNDIGGIKDGKERGVIATAADTSHVYRLESTGQFKVIYSYGWYLKKMIRDAQEKGAIPILLTLTPRNEWHEGNGHTRGFVYPVKEKTSKTYIERRNETYGTWCRQVAKETGVELVDVHNITANALDKKGQKKAAAYFNHDHTHTSLKGARLNAQSVAEGLRKNNSEAAKLLKK